MSRSDSAVRVLPGQAITLQMHYHRTEHWVVLRGTAEVTRGEERTMLHERESVFIPRTAKHQLKKTGRILFEMGGVDESIAREAMRLAMHKLPIKCKFVKKETEGSEE